MIKSTLDYRLDKVKERKFNCTKDYEYGEVLHSYIHLLMEVYSSPLSRKMNHLDFDYLKEIWYNIWDISNELYREYK